jgi:hypothetical protein
MTKRFNPKDYPLNSLENYEPIYVDDLALIERIGSALHLSFTSVGSEPYNGAERRKFRYVKARLIVPAERWKAILAQLKLAQNSESDLSILDQEEMTAH